MDVLISALPTSQGCYEDTWASYMKTSCPLNESKQEYHHEKYNYTFGEHSVDKDTVIKCRHILQREGILVPHA